MTSAATDGAGKYRIGAVSKLTGIPTVTIRMWERRYGVTEPERTNAGGRLYSDKDVHRLGLLKQAVDNGQAISAAAVMEVAELERICNRLPTMVETQDRPLRIAVLGDFLASKFSASKLNYCEVISARPAEAQAKMLEEVVGQDIDVLIVEQQSLDESSQQELAKLRQRVNATRAVVVYHYAQSAIVARLDASNTIDAIRAPVSAEEIVRSCRQTLGVAHAVPANDRRSRTRNAAVAKPRFTTSQLSELAKLTPVVQCECPQHMAELVSALQAFEGYAEQCESRSAKDAQVHQMLHQTTARARSLMENALAELIEQEMPGYFSS